MVRWWYSEIISAKWRERAEKREEETSQTGLIRGVVHVCVAAGCRVHSAL